MLNVYQKIKASRDARLPITPPILQKMLASLANNSNSFFNRTMLKAMYLFAFHAFLRLGEITYTGTKQQHFLLCKHIVLVEGEIKVLISPFQTSSITLHILAHYLYQKTQTNQIFVRSLQCNITFQSENTINQINLYSPLWMGHQYLEFFSHSN